MYIYIYPILRLYIKSFSSYAKRLPHFLNKFMKYLLVDIQNNGIGIRGLRFVEHYLL